MKEKIKVLFLADQVIQTGFARVAHSIIEYLPSNFESSAIGVNYYGDPHPYPYHIYPASLKGDVYGINRIEEITRIEKPDLIFIVNDAWIQDYMLDAIKNVYKDKTLPKIISYVPVDAKDHDSDWYKNYDIVTKVVAYTEFGKTEILKARPELADRILVIPHGVDTTVFNKIPLPKEIIKRQLYPDRADFYQDSFIVLNANRNQSRKRIDLTMSGFKLFAEGKPANVKLYLHMGITDSSVDIIKLAKRLNIQPRMIYSSKKNGCQSIPTERLNLIYNATDVGINTGCGEGWGLTACEHAITGSPQVVADHSALHELYSDCGLLIPTSQEYVLDNIMTTGYLVTPEAVAEKLELLYTNRKLYDELSKKGIEKFSKPEYQWENIAKRFAEVFDEVLDV
jgi:D-inositol-3-phosphate glycosyltransferase